MMMTASFKGLQPASAASALAKRRNRRIDTAHELLLRRELWRMGLRYRKHIAGLPGKPDLVFRGPRVLVFCDGDFWHGRHWERLKPKLDRGANATYWSAKIAGNIERDRRNERVLAEAGWRVVRLWETDIKRDPLAAAHHIRAVVQAGQQRAIEHRPADRAEAI